jgi:hypothetical protein
MRARFCALSIRVAIAFWRVRASRSLFCSLAMSASDARRASSSTPISAFS